MSLKFWTTLQNHKQAAFIEDGKITKTIPSHVPKTIFRRVAVVTEYKNKLAMARHASFEIWNKEGNRCHRSFYHKLILAPHHITEYEGDLLICSSGLEMFFLMNEMGDVKWEWWGYKNGIGGKNRAFFSDDWPIYQTTSDIAEIDEAELAHFNSIYLNGDGTFITSALKKQKIIEITIGKDGYKHVVDVDEHGCHSPFLHNGILIYGTEEGIKVGDRKVLPEFAWVKTIRPFEEGFAFTHDRGFVTTDAEWRVKESYPLPSPYQFVYAERGRANE